MRFYLLPFLFASTIFAGSTSQKAENPPQYPHMPAPGFTADIAFFYGQANEQGLIPALFSTSDGARNFTLDPVFMNFKWAPGFCLALGYNSDSEIPWTTKLHYSWFHNTAAKSGSVPEADLRSARFNPSLAPLLLGSIASSVRSNWEFHYNTLDWDVGRSYFPHRNVMFHPRFGVRGAIIDQDMRTGYSAFFDTGSSFVPVSSRWTVDQKFWGVGLRAGNDFAFFFDNNWGLFGNLFLSILPGKFKVKTHIEGAIFNGVGAAPFFAISSQNQWAFSPNLESEIGFRYDLFFGRKNHLFSFDISYLMSYWFKQNQISNVTIVFDDQGRNLYITPTSFNDDLLIQGGKLNFRFDF